MKQCIDCRYASPTTGHFMYTCDKHHGKFNAFEHPVCSDYLEDDGGHNCFECDYYTSKNFNDAFGKCERNNTKRSRYDSVCSYFKDF